MKRTLIKFRPWGISLFTGFGGMDAGAKRAGFQVLFGADKKKWTGTFFRNNTKESNPELAEHLQKEGAFLSGKKGNIKRLTGKKVFRAIRRATKLKVKPMQIDLMFGGPPCQHISVANTTNRNPFSKRNLLIFEMLRLVRKIMPKVVVIEQVPALLGPEMRPLWNKIQAAMDEMENFTWGYKVMNAMDYGGRQSRDRVIIMLVRKDLKVGVSFPEPSEPDLEKVSLHKLLPHVTHFSSGQFKDVIKSSYNTVFNTMTASGGEWAYNNSGNRWHLVAWEKMVLTEFEGVNLDGLTQKQTNTGFGNMVLPSLMEVICRHIRENILKF